MKDFRSKFSQLWRQLLDACKSGEGHDLVVLKAVIEILKALCNASLVSVRHTATFAGLQIGSFLVRAVLGMARAPEVANRQLDAEESKGGTKGRKAQTLNQRTEQLAGQIRPGPGGAARGDLQRHLRAPLPGRAGAGARGLPRGPRLLPQRLPLHVPQGPLRHIRGLAPL
jgi:hypothetical protein